MSAAHVLESAPMQVPLRQVEREMTRQLKSAQGQNGEAPAVRAGLSNLIIYCNSAELAEHIGQAVPSIVAVHPARVLMLAHEPNAPEEPITATVHTRMHGLGRGLRAFSEQVTLRACGQAGEHLPYAVRSLVIGDLPTNLWWAAPQPPAMAGALLYDLSEHAEQVLYDSFGWPEPARGMTATASWLDRFERSSGQGAYRVASDLTWRRLKPWRRLLGQALDPSTAPGALNSISSIEIDHGPHSVMIAWSLASWLALCLGWTVCGAKVQPAVQIDWRFDTPAGPRHMIVRRLADAPRGVRRVRIAWPSNGQIHALVANPEENERRLSIVPEGTDAVPRTLSVRSRPLAELVGRQLSDRERDPFFRQTVAVAQELARSVLGS